MVRANSNFIIGPVAGGRGRATARLPEAALGADTGFAALCATVGWKAATPAELARALARDDLREAQRAAWMPSLLASLAPVVVALPIGALIIGTMQLLISFLTQFEQTL